jgi:hypothetical protein
MFSKVNKCDECIAKGRTRACLTQVGAKKIIEIIYIPDISNIIFDYYNGARHYTKEEIAQLN